MTKEECTVKMNEYAGELDETDVGFLMHILTMIWRHIERKKRRY